MALPQWCIPIVRCRRRWRSSGTNHFATGCHTKIAGIVGTAEATRHMASVPSEDPAGVMGQIELFRQHALGNFRDLLVAVAKDTAMLFWPRWLYEHADAPAGKLRTRNHELFTMGVGHYTEPDVCRCACVFSGWNLTRPGSATDGTQHYQFIYNASQHETTEKIFSFPISQGRRQDSFWPAPPQTAFRTVSIH